MIARFSKTLFLAACALWPSALSAQWMPSPDSPPAMGYAPPGQYAAPSGPIQLANGYAPQPGMDYYGDGGAFGGDPYSQGPLPWERDGDSPFRRFLGEVLPNTYFQLDYINWSVDDIGAGAVGAPTARTDDVRRPIPLALFNAQTLTARNFIVPTTEPISFEKLSGLRGTFGVPLTIGTFEISAFAIEDGEAGIRNSIPGSPIVSSFIVPTNTQLIVPPGIDQVVFPVGTDIIIQPNGSFFFTPLLIPDDPEVIPTLFGDVIGPGSLIAISNTNAVAIPVLEKGKISQSLLVYDVGYSAFSRNELWGAESKLVLDIGPNYNGLTINPLVGFRYMSFNEEFQQTGVSTLNNNLVRGFRPVFTVNDPFFIPQNQPTIVRGPAYTSTIGSEVENTLFGLQFGTRAEYNHARFTLGVEPRISLGMNSYEATVTTRNLRNANDPLVRTTEDDMIFAPVFDLGMYARVHVTPYFSLQAGYNYTYLFRVTRPHDNIYYNDNGLDAPPGVVVDAETQDMHFQGLTIGGEFRFRDIKFR